MGETGKRFRSKRGHDRDDKNQRRRGNNNDKDDIGNDELVVYRILCPDIAIGSVIGKNGKVINSIRRETGAMINIVDPFPGSNRRVIQVYCHVKEKVEIDDEYYDNGPLCSAQEALLKVHSAIINAVTAFGESDNKHNNFEECQILVPSSQSSSIIGKNGATIKKLRAKTKAIIKVNAKDNDDPTQSCALEFDNFLLITGDPETVKKALFAVSTIMYKFPPREQIPLDTTIPEAPPSVLIPSDVPIYQNGGFYPSLENIVTSRSLPPMLSASHVSENSHYTDPDNVWPIYSSTVPVVSGLAPSPLSKELIFKVLCPSDKIGRVIGKGGSSIKSMRQDSGAHLEVVDSKIDREESAITVTATESIGDLKSMAVEAVLLLQGKISDEDDETVTIRLLVSSKVIGTIIGKGGSVINEIRKRTKADVRISKGDKPKCASPNDELIEVIGEVGSVRNALVQVVLRLRDDAFKDRDGVPNINYLPTVSDSLYNNGSGISVPSVPSVSPFVYDRMPDAGTGLRILPSSSLYGYDPYSIVGENRYGSSSYSAKLYGGLAQIPTFDMLIPENAIGKVIGKGGVVIENIRKISGATVEISETKSSRGDYITHISGTSEQKSTAEKLIQAFIMAP